VGGDGGAETAATDAAPRPERLNLLVEAYVVLAGLLAMAGAAAALGRFMIFFHLPLQEMKLEAIDCTTIAVPPGLPVAIFLGPAFEIARLTRNGIVCVRASVSNRAALVDVLCFDHTGMLTEERLDVRGLQLLEEYVTRGAAAAAAAAVAGGSRPLTNREAAVGLMMLVG